MQRALTTPAHALVAAAALAATCVVATSCTDEDNPLYCDEQTPCADPARSYCDLDGTIDGTENRCIPDPTPDAGIDIDAGIDAAPECTESSQCMVATAPICNAEGDCEACTEGATGDGDCAAKDVLLPLCKADGSCVACLGAGDCSETTPVCDDDACRGCQAHSECASEVCDPGTGACVADGDIVYVAKTGTDSASCGSQASPCLTIGGGQGGLAKVTVARDTVMVREGVYGESVAVTGGQTVVFVGPGATISPASSSNTPGLLVTSGTVTVDGLTLANATGGTDADGIRCPDSSSSLTLRNATVSGNEATGVQSTDCTLTIEGSTISGNDGGGVSASSAQVTIEGSTISGNDGGGVSISNCDFSLVNNFVQERRCGCQPLRWGSNQQLRRIHNPGFRLQHGGVEPGAHRGRLLWRRLHDYRRHDCEQQHHLWRGERPGSRRSQLQLDLLGHRG